MVEALSFHMTGYEDVFSSKAFGGEMDMQELIEYFHQCDLYPTASELDDAMHVVFRGEHHFHSRNERSRARKLRAKRSNLPGRQIGPFDCGLVRQPQQNAASLWLVPAAPGRVWLYSVSCLIAFMLAGRGLKAGRCLKKQEVLELTFHLFPPRGTGLTHRYESTWMTPVVDGQRASKFEGALVSL